MMNAPLPVRLAVFLPLLWLFAAPAFSVPVSPTEPLRIDFDTSFIGDAPQAIDFTVSFTSSQPLPPNATMTATLFNQNGEEVGYSEFRNVSGRPLLGCSCLGALPVGLEDDFFVEFNSTAVADLDAIGAQYRNNGVVDNTEGVISVGGAPEPYDWTANPVNTWVRVNDNTDPVPIVNATLLAAGIDGNTNGGTVQGSFDSWVSGVVAEELGAYYIPYGGGHLGSWLNGVWKLNLTYMDWSVDALPSDPYDSDYPWSAEYWAAPNWTTYLPESATPKSDMLPDLKPTSRHTYDAVVYDSRRNKITVGMPSRWIYNTETRETRVAAWVAADQTEKQGTTNSSLIYDEVTDRIYGSLNILSDSYVWIDADPETGDFIDRRKPIRKTPLCTVKVGREIIALGGSNGLQWAHFNMDTKAWTSGDIADLPAHNAQQEMQVCVYVPEWKKVLRQFTRSPMRGDWYLYDPITHNHEVYTPKGDVPLGRLPGRYAFYYPPGKSLVYIKLGQESGESVHNDVYVMRVVEPTAPPDPGECGLRLGLPECPRAPVTYRPKFPPLGQYSVPGVCQAIHSESDPQVTLIQGELLKDALLRLRLDPNYDKNVGGIINIPYSVKIQECDYLDYNNQLPDPGGVTVRGIPGPGGELPRMYCRVDNQDGGTIPGPAKRTVALQFSIGKTLSGGGRALVENMHIDGYVRPLYSNLQHTVFRNVYVHHAADNNIASGDLWDRFEDVNLEVCGVESAYSGRTDRHNFYIHRNNTVGYDLTFTLVDSFAHSCVGCSSVKSIANVNNIWNNDVRTVAVTDPSYTERRSTKLLDIIACAQNEFSGNKLIAYKPQSAGAVDVVALRNRRNIFGCDEPEPAWEGAYDAPTKVEDSPQNDPAWWTGLGGETQFRTDIFNNQFEITGAFANQWWAIQAMGTYPTKVWVQLQNPTCWLETPATWYERFKIFVRDNSYKGNWGGLYENRPPTHSTSNCGAPPAGPGPSSDMFDIGPGEEVLP